MEKTFEDCLNELGRKLGWLPPINQSTQVPLSFAKMVAELYCQSQKAKAWEEGYHEMNEVAKQIMIGIVPERPSNPYKP